MSTPLKIPPELNAFDPITKEPFVPRHFPGYKVGWSIRYVYNSDGTRKLIRPKLTYEVL